MPITLLADCPDSVGVSPAGLSLAWDGGDYLLDAGHLRANCRCATCRKLWLQGSAVASAPFPELTAASPAGSYGLQLHFTDGHDRGIYPWIYLRELIATAKDGSP